VLSGARLAGFADITARKRSMRETRFVAACLRRRTPLLERALEQELTAPFSLSVAWHILPVHRSMGRCASAPASVAWRIRRANPYQRYGWATIRFQLL